MTSDADKVIRDIISEGVGPEKPSPPGTNVVEPGTIERVSLDGKTFTKGRSPMEDKNISGPRLLELLYEAATGFEGMVHISPLNPLIKHIRRVKKNRNPETGLSPSSAELRLKVPDRVARNLQSHEDKSNIFIIAEIDRRAWNELMQPEALMRPDGRAILPDKPLDSEV